MKRFPRPNIREVLQRQAREDEWAWQEFERKMNMAPETIKGLHHVVVKKAELVKHIQKNRDGHRNLYEEAHAGYRAALLNTVGKMYDDAKKGLDVQHFIQLLGMLEMSIDDTVLITASEYSQYVMDDWGWKEKFTASVSNYTKR